MNGGPGREALHEDRHESSTRPARIDERGRHEASTIRHHISTKIVSPRTVTRNVRTGLISSISSGMSLG